MNPTAMFIAALIALPAVGLVTWAWFAMARVEAQLRSFNGFEGLHFEIGPQAAHHAEGSRWPIPG
jgi:hypothetical protein